MSSLRSFLAAFVAAPLLLAGPALAATTPASTSPGATAARSERPAATPQVIYLTGTVLGSNGVPCPGACVFPTTNPRLIAVTDERGTFQLQVPAVADLHLQADYAGRGLGRIAIVGQPSQPVRIVLSR